MQDPAPALLGLYLQAFVGIELKGLGSGLLFSRRCLIYCSSSYSYEIISNKKTDIPANCWVHHRWDCRDINLPIGSRICS